MNVEVLGGDYTQELGDFDWEEVGQTLIDTAIGMTAAFVGQRLTPTQKAVAQQVTNTSTSMSSNPPPKPEKTFMEQNGTYIMIGGAVLIGVIVMMKTRRSRK
jgi:hypothetical protein